MTIQDWPLQERPRERFLSHGAEALSDAELLALFLRTGLPGESAVDIARNILAHYDGNLARLVHAAPTELAQIRGIGVAKAVQLAATMELARRALKQGLHEQDLMTSPEAVKAWLRLRIGRLPHEVFWALWLDSGHRLIASDELFRGSLTQTSVYPREVVKRALQHNAAAVIIAHNHPSGRSAASTSDIALTRNLKDALGLIDVALLDHFIVAPGMDIYSLAEHGQMS